MSRNEEKWLREYAEKSGESLEKLIRRREAGEPLQYILGEWEFYGYNFKVGKGVLIPRPETEFLVDLAKEYCVRGAPVFDLCAGSGCVGIAIAKETHRSSVIAVEKSPRAIEYLKKNIALNKVEKQVHIIECNIFNRYKIRDQFFQTLKKNCALASIVMNPPYLSKSEMQSLQKEVTHEPEEALYGGGEDGLDFYRNFFDKWNVKHNPLFACEVGDEQAAAVCEIMENKGLSPKVLKDYSGIDRIVYTLKS
ncbi:MAG: peptide chain release factor N(5)-glutamine methyltransferase [Oscillospiraceae bacterium]|jgi:release factor glutamine methyltransferase|nr:peptide chain release factor N(5)-glutamine methyltransferase [Oscillospiraceae bacterium]